MRDRATARPAQPAVTRPEGNRKRKPQHRCDRFAFVVFFGPRAASRRRSPSLCVLCGLCVQRSCESSAVPCRPWLRSRARLVDRPHGINLTRVFRLRRHPHRRACAARPHAHRAWRRRDAGVHAGRHPGRRQRRHASRSRIARRRDPAQQHLPPVSAARRRSDCAPRRAAPLHRLDEADPHRQRRLSGLQPRRAPHDRRAGRAFQVASGRLGAPAHAGKGRRHPGAARIRHRDGARRMPRAPVRRRGGAHVDGAHAAVGVPRARSVSRAARRPGAGRHGRPTPARRSSASCRAACFRG